MFHRVKTETEQKTVSQPERAEPKSAATPSVAQISQPVVQNETPAPAPQIMQSTPAPVEKETPMTKDNAQTDIETASEAAKAIDIPAAGAGYAAAPANTAARGGNAYGSYGGYNAPAQGTASEEDAQTESRLVIGQGITMSGEIESCDHLVVEGTIEAALKGARVLDVYEAGTYYGTVNIEEATVAGRFEGELTVNGRLTVRSTGTITGTISYKEIEIEAGAVVDGKLIPLKASEGATPAKKPEKAKAQKEAAALAKARELKAKNEQSSTVANASEEGELFASEAAE